jgi:DNA ligase-1
VSRLFGDPRPSRSRRRVELKTVAQRIVGYTGIAAIPSAASFSALIASDGIASPMPASRTLFLAHQLNDAPDKLGPVDQWMVEWKWDGIRGQLVKRAGAIWLWSRGEELVTGRFPEFHALQARIPDGTVIDGEIVVWKDGRVRPFGALQTRIGRKSLPAKILAEAPAALLAYDLLEENGTDLRMLPQHERRARLELLVPSIGDEHLQISPLLSLPTWDAYARLRAESRSRGVEGFMLKRRDARYGVGRTKESGTWWKWKIDPMTIDAVLIYAQRGHGRRASLYTDYTFAVWSEEAEGGRRLIPFAKAYSGLSDEEIKEVDAIIRKTTIEKFGPVRSVTPTLVFELGFEGIARSPRHKSGIAVRFPRILRRRIDKPVDEADTLDNLNALLRP